MLCGIITSLYASYKDLRGLPDLMDKTLLVIKAPPDTIMECDNEEEVGVVSLYMGVVLQV